MIKPWTPTTPTPALGNRDWQYVEDRLLAPATPADEALDRLKQLDRLDAHAELMAAMQVFTDACRTLRYRLRDERTRSPR